MAEYAYTSGTGKLKKFLSEIPTSGVPDKLIQKELEKRGYKTKEDRNIIPILKAIGFLDDSNKPTKRYTDYRNSEISKKVLAEGIREGYPDLFKTFPDAYKQDNKKLKGYFGSVTKVGEAAINYMVGTFEALCSLADFDGELELPPEEGEGTAGGNPPRPGTKIPKITETWDGGAVTINVNLQLSLPETKDYEVYDKIFESLKKNLLDRE